MTEPDTKTLHNGLKKAIFIRKTMVPFPNCLKKIKSFMFYGLLTLVALKD